MQKFNSIQHWRIAELLFTHDNASNPDLERITMEGQRDACEFRFINGESPLSYLRIRKKVTEELIKEYEQKEI